ncbi:transposase family protein [Streptomyces noursei]|uniref:transposase family protein n=1 Tax=Streptomyces noursei TaxID=1971 RepID=UPI003789AC19
MVIVTCDGGRVCRLRPYDRARCALVYLRKHDTLEQLAADFAIGAATAWRYVNDTIGCLAAFAPPLMEALTCPSPLCVEGFVKQLGVAVLWRGVGSRSRWVTASCRPSACGGGCTSR